jgi:2OG-Fe(II) oxygenase superfamily
MSASPMTTESLFNATRPATEPGGEQPTWPLPQLADRSVTDMPFRYATFSRCLSPDTGDAIMDWLEETAPWSLTQTDFYEQHEFSCWDSPSPVASFLTSSEVLHIVRSTMGDIFGRSFEQTVSVVCHRLVPPQRIGIHNDSLAGQESHRLVIQLNRGLTDTDGGVLMLFNSDDPADIHKLLRPVNLSGFAFEISADSHHAVSQVHGGARYTLIYSLTAATG